MNSNEKSNHQHFEMNFQDNYAFSGSIDDSEANPIKYDRAVPDSVIISSFDDQNGALKETKSAPLKLETVIEWSNLSVEVNVRGKSKKILDNVTGEINNLEMMAILGPSGSGKTTLLNIISGRIKNYTGTVNFYSKDKKCTFAYVPQNDYVCPHLTVKESLLFSSRLRNASNHRKEVEDVLTAFNLTRIKNHFAKNCSGGELKRLSIGLEMISKPKILILDEPTSGLDAFMAYTVIEVLRNVNKSTAIITTIHQPNSNLFQLFDKCYILTSGKCIYSGTPSYLVEHLKLKIDTIIPSYTNPADFILDVANNVNTKSGLEIINKLSSHENEKNLFLNSKFYDSSSKIFLDPINNEPTTLNIINRTSFTKKKSFFNEYFQNVKKLMITAARDPQQTIFRFLNNLLFPFLIYMLTTDLAAESGCVFLPDNSTHILKETSYERYDRQMKGIQGVGIVFLNTVNGFFTAMIPAVLILSRHINVLKKEYLNSYYSLTSFYFAVVTVNFVYCLIFTFENTISFFYFIGHSFTWSKFLLCWSILLLSSTIGDLMGLMLSILMPKDNLTAVVVGCFEGFGLFVFSGFFIPLGTMVPYLRSASWFIFCRHIFQAIIRVFYGRNCSIEDHMVFDFDNLVEFFKYYNYNNKKSFLEMEDLPTKVRKALRDNVWTKRTIIDLAENVNDLNSTEVEELESFWNEKTSYILETFDCQDVSLLSENFAVILATVVFFVIICYLLLILKIRK